MGTPWPPFALRLHAPGLTLRVPTDDELAALAVAAVGNVLAPEDRTFMGHPWTQRPSPEFERGVLQYHWGLRAEMRPESWRFEFGVFPVGATHPVGVQGVGALNFPTCRAVDTGSWLLPQWRGRGIGLAMRAMVLEFAFRELGAREANTSLNPRNVRSLRITTRLGYLPNGQREVMLTPGEGFTEHLYRLPRDGWIPRPDLTFAGVAPVREMLGIETPPPT